MRLEPTPLLAQGRLEQLDSQARTPQANSPRALAWALEFALDGTREAFLVYQVLSPLHQAQLEWKHSTDQVQQTTDPENVVGGKERPWLSALSASGRGLHKQEARRIELSPVSLRTEATPCFPQPRNFRHRLEQSRCLPLSPRPLHKRLSNAALAQFDPRLHALELAQTSPRQLPPENQ